MTLSRRTSRAARTLILVEVLVALLAGQALDHLFASELFQVVGRLVSPGMGGRWPAEIPHLTSQFGGGEASRIRG